MTAPVPAAAPADADVTLVTDALVTAPVPAAATGLAETDPAKIWEFYLVLVAVEAAFRNLKGDLALRPIYHQRQDRIEAHIFVAFLAYCLHATLRAKLHGKAPGLTPRAVLERNFQWLLRPETGFAPYFSRVLRAW